MTLEYDSDVRERRYHVTDERPPSATVVAAVADAAGAAPTDLSPLGSRIDADALDALADDEPDSPACVRVSFVYEGYDVTIRGDGTVALVTAGAPDATR